MNGARSGSIRVGLLGLGTIGRAVARALVGGLPGVVLAGAMSRDAARARGFLATLPGPPPLLDLDRLVAESDLVVEAATQAALVQVAPRVLDAGRDLLVLGCAVRQGDACDAEQMGDVGNLRALSELGVMDVRSKGERR